MKNAFKLCAILIVSCSLVCGQFQASADESRPTDDPRKPDTAKVEPGADDAPGKAELFDNFEPLPDARFSPDAQKPPAAVNAMGNAIKLDGWKPRYRVVLKLTNDGTSRTVDEPFVVLETTLRSKEESVVLPDGSSVTRVVQFPTTVFKPQMRRTVCPGTALLAADEVSVTMAAATDGKAPGSFAFETRGRTRLLLAPYVFDCNSAKLVDGVLTLTEVSSPSGPVRMRAEKIEIDLSVLGVDSSQFDQPIEALVPATSPPLDDAPRFFADPDAPSRRFSDDGSSFPAARSRQPDVDKFEGDRFDRPAPRELARPPQVKEGISPVKE